MLTKEKKLYDLVRSLYEEHEQRLKPLPPWILVRVLPKTQTVASGLLYLPENQNKVLYEGIVLSTYTPFYRELRKTKNGEEEETIEVFVKPTVELGDRVLFAHYEGLPVSFLDTAAYRVVKEETILGTLQSEKTSTEVEIRHLLEEDKADELLGRYLIVRKDLQAMTVTGE